MYRERERYVHTYLYMYTYIYIYIYIMKRDLVTSAVFEITFGVLIIVNTVVTTSANDL